jgi:putative spermidine/putrescine transport system permease protein
MSGRNIDDLLRFLCKFINIAVVVFLMTPIVVTAIMSLDSRSYLGPLPPPSLSLRWFKAFFSDSYFLSGLATSLKLAVLSVSISLLAGLTTAYALDRSRFRGKDALVSFFLSPLVVPPVVIGFALLLFLSKLGLINGFARLLCGHIIITVPYAIRATLAAMSEIEDTYTEAALILGANERQAFWSVTFPLARAGIVSGGIFAFAVSMDDVAVSIMLTDAKTYTLPIALISSMRANFDLSIAAASMVLMGSTVILIILLEKLVGLNRAMGQGGFR